MRRRSNRSVEAAGSVLAGTGIPGMTRIRLFLGTEFSTARSAGASFHRDWRSVLLSSSSATFIMTLTAIFVAEGFSIEDFVEGA